MKIDVKSLKFRIIPTSSFIYYLTVHLYHFKSKKCYFCVKKKIRFIEDIAFYIHSSESTSPLMPMITALSGTFLVALSKALLAI